MAVVLEVMKIMPARVFSGSEGDIRIHLRVQLAVA
jgi:hypothetical protein